MLVLIWISIWYVSLGATVAYAFARGGSDERRASLIILVGFVATLIAQNPSETRWSGGEIGIFLVDLAALAALYVLALRSDRYWPLWVAGFQLNATLSHVARLMDPNFLRFVYAVAVQMWSYPMLLAIIVGSRNHHRRRLQQTTSTTLWPPSETGSGA